MGSAGRLIGAIAVFVFALGLYGNTLFHGYVLDDASFFTKNVFVQRGLGGVGKILTTELGAGAGERHYTYRPLVLVMFAVEKALFGNNPVVGHGLNILLYAGACAGLHLLLSRLLIDLPHVVPLLVALLFAAHPAHAEVVANIKSRDEILCFFLLVGLLWCLVRSAAAHRARRLGLSLGLFALALLTKEHAITFVALVPLALHFFTPLPVKAAARITGLYALVAVLYLILRKAVVGAVLMPGDFGGLTNVLTMADTWSEALGTRLMILWNYLRLLVFPLRLSWDYSYNIVPLTTLADPRAIAAGGVFLALSAVGLRGLKNRSLVSFGLMFFLVTFSVVSNVFLPLRWTLAERFLFTPSLGVCLAAVVGLHALFERLPVSPKARRTALPALIGAVALLFSARTFARNGDWKSEFDLYARDAGTHPEGARIHNALANASRNRAAGNVGETDRARLLHQARAEYLRSIAIFPDFPLPHEGLAYVNYALGDFNAAELAARRAIALSPVSAEATHLLAVACFSQGRYEEAATLFKRTRLLSPAYPGVEINLAATYVEMGRHPEAVSWLEEAIRKSPGAAEPHARLGEIYRTIGDIDRARRAYEQAYALQPGPGLRRALQELAGAAGR